jgi:hypothetical protein
MNARRTDWRRRGHLALSAVAVLAALAGTSLPARAEPTAAEKETARGLMAEGRDLRDRHELKGALKSFVAADSIMRVPTTALEVARTQAALGLLVEARETLHRLASLPQAANDPQPFRDARAEADKLDDELQRRIGAIRFDVRKPADSGELVLSVDGVPLLSSILDVPFRSNPGHHLVVGKLGATDIMREIDVREVETTTVVLDFTRVSVAGARSDGNTPAAESTERRRTHPLVYVGFGVGAAGVVVGTVTGALALSSKKSAERGCLAGQCPPSTWSDLDHMDTYASVSTVSFVFAGLGVACGVTTLVLTRPSATSGASAPVVRITAAPRGLVLSGGF